MEKVLAQDQLVLMEDNRFKDIKKIKKKELPSYLHWFVDQDYFTNEMLGIYSHEIGNMKNISEKTFKLFEQATDKIINSNQLDYLEIPSFFHEAIKNSWNNRKDNPFFLGRFDLNGGVDGMPTKVIEFNADTFSTLPETLLWQKIQNQEANNINGYFSIIEEELVKNLREIRNRFDHEEVNFLATSFGHPEDVQNCNVAMNLASQAGFKTYYKNLEDVIFSVEEGIFIEYHKEEFYPIDVWFKIIPWDWMFNEELDLAKDLTIILEKKLAIVLNPPYTSIWQNKKFLAYITENFPNQVIAETYTSRNGMTEFVEKPIYGRIGENILLQSDRMEKTKGDFENQTKIYQKYYPLAVDDQRYCYQFGMFYSDKSLALNMRLQKSKIINDYCDFMSHFIV